MYEMKMSVGNAFFKRHWGHLKMVTAVKEKKKSSIFGERKMFSSFVGYNFLSACENNEGEIWWLACWCARCKVRTYNMYPSRKCCREFHAIPNLWDSLYLLSLMNAFISPSNYIHNLQHSQQIWFHGTQWAKQWDWKLHTSSVQVYVTVVKMWLRAP